MTEQLKKAMTEVEEASTALLGALNRYNILQTISASADPKVEVNTREVAHVILDRYLDAIASAHALARRVDSGG